jgi:predicted O-methyltransferase YrrM
MPQILKKALPFAKRRIHQFSRRRNPWVRSSQQLSQQFSFEYDTLVQDIRRAGTNSLSHFRNGYTKEGGLKLQQNPHELAGLILFLKMRIPINRYLEIGSASGGTGRFLSERVGFDEFTSLDDAQHPDASDQKKNFAGIRNFRQFVGDSHSAQARQFVQDTFEERNIDVAFVDGDHSATGVAQDLDLVLPYCAKGSWIILHDTVACEGVEQAWLGALESERLRPVAEFMGSSVPLGIAIGEVQETRARGSRKGLANAPRSGERGALP